MGNDPVNLIDPSGGSFIPCPGTSALGLFFMKAGEMLAKGLSVVSSISPWVNMGATVTRVAGVDVYNRSVQLKILNTQLSGNVTMGVGTSTQTIGEPPIFWEEENFPIIELWDAIYADMIYQINPTAAVLAEHPKFPGMKFLRFHYLGKIEPGRSSKKNRDRSLKENSGNLADQIKDGDNMHRHEVPYASTIEGGAGAITFPAFGGQNVEHGRALREFYKRNNFKGGEEFLVPLPPKADPQKIPKFDPQRYPGLISPKRYDRSPFQAIPFGPGGVQGIGRFLQWLFRLSP